MLVLSLHIPLLALAGRAAAADAPAVAQAAEAAGAAAPQPRSPRAPNTFSVYEYRVEGNTLLSQVEIERAVYPCLGDDRLIADVEAARQRLEKTYHDRGYLTVLVNIPPQKVSEGVVTLKVIEAPVGKLSVQGERHFSEGMIREAVPALAEGSVPDFNEVQKELAQANRSADRRVTPILKASDTPGRVDVELEVKDALPLHGSVELNNRYSQNTSHLRAIGQLHYDNLFQSDQSISAQYQTSPLKPSDVEVYSLSYVIPTASGPVWALYAVRSNSNVAAVGDLNVIGNGDIVGARLIAPLGGIGPGFYHSFTAGFDYKRFKQEVVLTGADTSVNSPIHYVPFSAQYSATWQDLPQQGSAAAGDISSTTLDAGFSFAVSGLGSNGMQFDEKRSGASASFLILHPGLGRVQALPHQWSLSVRFDGQIASGPLISNEQFGAGGADSVRGYDESERLGDDGWRSSMELRTPGLLSGYDPRIEKSYLLAFAEAAQLDVREPLPGTQSHFSLVSVGLGFRFKARGLNIDLDGAHVLKNGAETRAGANRGLFRVNYGF